MDYNRHTFRSFGLPSMVVMALRPRCWGLILGLRKSSVMKTSSLLLEGPPPECGPSDRPVRLRETGMGVSLIITKEGQKPQTV